MSILDEMLKSHSDFTHKEGVQPSYCYLSCDEGFDLLKDMIPTMTLTHIQRVELNIVIKEKNIMGLRQAFSKGTFRGAKIVIREDA